MTHVMKSAWSIAVGVASVLIAFAGISQAEEGTVRVTAAWESQGYAFPVGEDQSYLVCRLLLEKKKMEEKAHWKRLRSSARELSMRTSPREPKWEKDAARSQTQMGIVSLHGIPALVISLRVAVDHLLFSVGRENLRGSPAEAR